MENEKDLSLRDLNSFYGSVYHHAIFGIGTNVKLTDGAMYVYQNGYAWFISDALIYIGSKLKNEEFLTIELKLNEDKTAKMIITDGNEKVLYTQKYEYTDAQREFKMFLTDNVLMLASEYWGGLKWIKKSLKKSLKKN